MSNIKHGMKHTRLYRTWLHIKTRCYNQKYSRYKDYGGRGIKVCDEWRNDFMNFYNWSMKNGYKENLTIDRIDNDKGYSPSNCRWQTNKQQCRNRRNNKMYTANGEAHCLAEWCEILNLSYSTVYARLSRDWPIEQALELEERHHD